MATGQQSASVPQAASNGQTPAQYVPRDATASPATHGMGSPHATPGVAGVGGNPAQSPHNPASVSNAVTAPAPVVAGANASARPGAQFPLFGANGANMVANYNAEQLNAMRIHLLVTISLPPPLNVNSHKTSQTQLGHNPQAAASVAAQAPPQAPPS